MANPITDLPSYQSHKVVQAARIVEIRRLTADDEHPDMLLVLEGDFEHTTDATWVREKRAQVGGYFVRYSDGFTSYSPAEAFEGGYTLQAPPEPAKTRRGRSIAPADVQASDTPSTPTETA